MRSDIVLETRPTRLFYKIEEQSVGIFRKVCEKWGLVFILHILPLAILHILFFPGEQITGCARSQVAGYAGFWVKS